MEITKEDLRKYLGLKTEIAALQAEIDALYSPVGSPPTFTLGGRSSTPGDPTARAVHKIIMKRQRLEKKLYEMVETSERIEEWVNRIDDHHIAAIIRYHFLVGLSWRQTCKRVYGYADPDVCRVIFNRYMDKQEKL